MKIDLTNLQLHYNINLDFNPNGKQLSKILKEHFLIYIRKENKENNNEKIIETKAIEREIMI